MDLNMCRLCCENMGITNIFDDSCGCQISAKIMYCCKNVRISFEDGLPARVCGSCEEELTLTYEFVQKCEATDEKLRSLTFISSEVNECDTKPVKVEENHKAELEDNFNYESDFHSPLETNHDEVTKSETTVTPLNLKIIKAVKRICKPKVSRKQSCMVCGKLCDNPSTLAVHMRKHSEHRPYACSSCDKKYKDGGGLKRHIERNHNRHERKRKFVCETCGKAFYSKHDVKIHMRTHTGETPYACGTCPLKFTQIGALLRHQLRHTGERTHSCSKCNKKFQTKEDLRRHQVAHSSEKNYICPTCNVPFKYKNNLRKHIKLHLSTNNYICNHCGRSFNAKGNLKIHIDNMHSDKSGFCDVCSKNVPNVEVHMWRHTGKRPLKCDLCTSSFFEKKSLTRHLNFRHKHTDKFKCTVLGCTMTFPSQPMLEYHTAKFHGSSIPFPCDRCSRGFYRKNDLVRHKLRNHRDKLEL